MRKANQIVIWKIKGSYHVGKLGMQERAGDVKKNNVSAWK
jgi:hypothetical protein